MSYFNGPNKGNGLHQFVTLNTNWAEWLLINKVSEKKNVILVKVNLSSKINVLNFLIVQN